MASKGSIPFGYVLLMGVTPAYSKKWTQARSNPLCACMTIIVKYVGAVYVATTKRTILATL